MNKLLVGRLLLTFVLATSTVLSFVLDWSPNHLLNPLWHPHARFHGALLLFLLAGVSGTAAWLLWRKSTEPEIAVRVAACVSLSFWTPLFYITTLLPSSTSWAGAPDKDPRLTGSFATPNMMVAAVFVLVSVAGLWLSFAATAKRPEPKSRRMPA